MGDCNESPILFHRMRSFVFNLSMKPLSTPFFKQALLYAGIIAVVLICLSLYEGKVGAFLLLNNDWGYAADVFFHLTTYLGDGIMWVPFTLLVLFFKRHYCPLTIASIIISTLITQIAKNIVFKGIERPFAAIIDHSTIHLVPGVDMHTMNSFPSGHTTTAFTLFLLACLLIHKKWIVPVGLLYATIAAYSRIYLAQHFPLDISGGILSAMLTVWLARHIQGSWEKNRKR